MDTGSGRALPRRCVTEASAVSDFQMVSASGPIASTRASRRYGPGHRQTHLLRPCEVRVLRRQHADRDLPPAGGHVCCSINSMSCRSWSPSPSARPTSPRQSNPGSGDVTAANRRTGAYVGDHAAAVDQRAMIDKQRNRRLQPRESSNAGARQGTPTRLPQHRREFGRRRG
jgi:hypothetical protein